MLTQGSQNLMSLDRRDNDKGYVPGNVRWTTREHNTAIQEEEGEIP